MPYYWSPYPYPHYYWSQQGPYYAPAPPAWSQQAPYFAPVQPYWNQQQPFYSPVQPYANQQAPYYAPATRSDAEIGTNVVNALQTDTWIDANTIDVKVNSGIVTLTGTVPNLFQKRQAGDDAWNVPGVVDVRNDLVIAG